MITKFTKIFSIKTGIIFLCAGFLFFGLTTKTFAANTTLYVNTASTAGGDCTTNATTGANRACATLSDAEALLPADITAAGGANAGIWTIMCEGQAADTVAVTFSGTVTDATHYIVVTTNPAATYGRHDGKWNTNKYRLEVTTGTVITVSDANIRIEGLQIYIAATSNYTYGIDYNGAGVTGTVYIDHNIIKGESSKLHYGTYGGWGVTNSYVFDNLIYGLTAGNSIGIYGRHDYAYNNTIDNTYWCINTQSSNTMTVVNNLLYACTNAAISGTYKDGSDYNATNLSTLTYSVTNSTNIHDRLSQTFSFTDAAGLDFHLISSDAGAKDYGKPDPGAGLFSDDIDGQTRVAPWDIGADEYITVDTTPPTVDTYSPVDNATGVAINSNLVLTFSENVAKGTGNILIKKTSDGSTVQTIDVANAAVSISNATVTINPPSDLEYSTGYYVTMASGVLTDTATTPNAYAGISDNTTWNFTTAAAPDLTAPTPGNSGTITTASVTSNSLTLNWTKAADNVSAESALVYRVYKSSSNNIDTVANIFANGTAVNASTTDIATLGVSGLNPSTTYYFNVVVADEAGNSAVYTTKSQATIAAAVENIYIAQNSAGSDTGADCSNAHSATWFNTSGNWSNPNTDGKIGPGDTVHLCGTFTFTAGTAGLTAQGSGTNGNSITIKFETGAVLQAPYFFNGSGSPVGGGLNIASRSYIIVDGGVTCGTTQGGVDNATPCNGTIRNTANGTVYANQVHSRLLEANACTPGCEIKNMHLGPVYVRVPDVNLSSTAGSTSCGPTSCTVTTASNYTVGTGAVLYIKNNSVITNGSYTVTGNPTATTFTINGGPGSGTGQGGTASDESMNSNGQDLSQYDAIAGSADGIKLHNNVVHDGGWLINLQGAAVQVYNNQVYNMDHGISMTPIAVGEAGPIIHDNHIHDMSNWDDTLNGLNNNHHDGIHFLIDLVHLPQYSYSNYRVYNNVFDGNVGTPNTWFFNRASSDGGAIFNNVFGCSPAHNIGALGYGDDTFDGSFTTNLLMVNNTVTCLGDPTAGGSSLWLQGLAKSTSNGITVKNNIVQGQQYEAIAYVYTTEPGWSSYFTAGGIDYNLYQKQGLWTFGARGIYTTALNDSVYDSSLNSSPNNWCWGSSSGAFCQHSILPAGSGQDAHSGLYTTANLKLNADGSPQATSPAVAAGANLTSLCVGDLTPLCSDINGNARPSSGAWDIGAYQTILSSTKAITAFNFTSPSATGSINEGAKTISITVPYGTALTALVPTITITGSSVAPLSGVAQDFTSPVHYIVTAEDSSTADYTVTVNVTANTSTSITSFNFASPATTGTVDNTAHTVALTVPFGTTVTALTPTIVLATGATISPTSGTPQNFTSSVNYTVTAQDGTTQQVYAVTVTVAPNTAKAITTFDFNGLTPAVVGTIDETGKTIALTVPYGTAVTALVPTITHTGASISPASGVAANFSTPQTYTVTAANASTQPYAVTVTVGAAPTPTPTPVVSSRGGGSPAVWTLPTIPLSGFKITINNGTLTTSNRNVTLNFSAGTDIKKIAISMTGDFTDASQEDYTPTKQLDLCSKFGGLIKNPTCPNGTYKVYAQFYTAYGRTSANALASSSITLTTGSTDTSKYNFTRNLSLYMTGKDVKALQQYLNSHGFIISKTGAGSPGKETTLFGTLTYKALAKFQKSIGWSGTGFFGPMTREYLRTH